MPCCMTKTMKPHLIDQFLSDDMPYPFCATISWAADGSFPTPAHTASLPSGIVAWYRPPYLLTQVSPLIHGELPTLQAPPRVSHLRRRFGFPPRDTLRLCVQETINVIRWGLHGRPSMWYTFSSWPGQVQNRRGQHYSRRVEI